MAVLIRDQSSMAPLQLFPSHEAGTGTLQRTDQSDLLLTIDNPLIQVQYKLFNRLLTQISDLNHFYIWFDFDLLSANAQNEFLLSLEGGW